MGVVGEMRMRVSRFSAASGAFGVARPTYRAILVAAVGLATWTTAAEATVQVAIDLTHQRMHVDSSEGTFDWPISSARSGFSTPHGSYAPTHLELLHYSRKYHMSPMPHAIFFRGGYAIHGTYSTASLGRPASHGCVRLSPGNATALYDMVKHEGARIAISGTPPASQPFATEVARRRVRPDDTYAAPAPAAYDGYGYDDAIARPRRARQSAGYQPFTTPSYGDGFFGGQSYAPAADPYGYYR